MKMIVVVALALVAAVAALPVEKEPTKILRSEVVQQPDGSYIKTVETDDGTKLEEVGELKEVYDEEKKEKRVVIVVRGSYEYVDNTGNPEKVVYYSDETGYHAEGPSIPVAPAARR